MIDTKREIIVEEGVPVEIYDGEAGLVDESIALIGKATRQFFSEISLESHRQGQFFPELNIGNGLIIKNLVTDEDYIIVANYPEVIDRQRCTTITRMIVCNSCITVKRLVEDADKFGNIIKEFQSIYEDLSVYAEPIDNEVRQADPGRFPNTRYKIFAPDIELEIDDQILIDVRGSELPFKLAGNPDYLTFKGLIILEVVSETRN